MQKVWVQSLGMVATTHLGVAIEELHHEVSLLACHHSLGSGQLAVRVRVSELRMHHKLEDLPHPSICINTHHPPQVLGRADASTSFCESSAAIKHDVRSCRRLYPTLSIPNQQRETSRQPQAGACAAHTEERQLPPARHTAALADHERQRHPSSSLFHSGGLQYTAPCSCHAVMQIDLQIIDNCFTACPWPASVGEARSRWLI